MNGNKKKTNRAQITQGKAPQIVFLLCVVKGLNTASRRVFRLALHVQTVFRGHPKFLKTCKILTLANHSQKIFRVTPSWCLSQECGQGKKRVSSSATFNLPYQGNGEDIPDSAFRLSTPRPAAATPGPHSSYSEYCRLQTGTTSTTYSEPSH